MDKSSICHEIAMLLLQKKINQVEKLTLTGNTVKNSATMYFQILDQVEKNFDEVKAKLYLDPKVEVYPLT